MISRTKVAARAARKESAELRKLLLELKKQKQPLLDRVAQLLARPRKKAVVVNLDKLNRLTKENDIVIVPGKVLGKGKLEHKLTVAAFSFSESAAKKLEKSEMLSITELIKKAKPSEIKIIA